MIRRSSSLLKLRMWSILRSIRIRMLQRILMGRKTIPHKVGMLPVPKRVQVARRMALALQVPKRVQVARKMVLVLVVPRKVLAEKRKALVARRAEKVLAAERNINLIRRRNNRNMTGEK